MKAFLTCLFRGHMWSLWHDQKGQGFNQFRWCGRCGNVQKRLNKHVNVEGE